MEYPLQDYFSLGTVNSIDPDRYGEIEREVMALLKQANASGYRDGFAAGVSAAAGELISAIPDDAHMNANLVILLGDMVKKIRALTPAQETEDE